MNSHLQSGAWLNAGGTALVEAKAIPNSDNGGNGSGGGGTPSNANLGNPTSTNAVPREASKEVPSHIRVFRHEWHEFVHRTPPDDEPDIKMMDRTWENDRPSTAYLTEISLEGAMTGIDYTWPADRAIISGFGPRQSGTQIEWSALVTNRTTNTVDPWPIPYYVHYDFHVTNCVVNAEEDHKVDCDLTKKTEFQLVTGGKARSANTNPTNYYGIYVRANRTMDGRPANYWSQDPRTTEIPASAIRVFGREPGATHYVFVPLADNSTNDFTVDTPFKNFTFSVTQQKYELISQFYCSSFAFRRNGFSQHRQDT